MRHARPVDAEIPVFSRSNFAGGSRPGASHFEWHVAYIILRPIFQHVLEGVTGIQSDGLRELDDLVDSTETNG